MLGRRPAPIVLAVLMAVLVFFTALWKAACAGRLDSFALAIAVPAGTGAAIGSRQRAVIVVLMGMATARLAA